MSLMGISLRDYLVFLSKHKYSSADACNVIIPTDDIILSQESETFELVLLSENYKKYAISFFDCLQNYYNK